MREFSEEHKKNLSEANKRRGQRQREEIEKNGKRCTDCGIIKDVSCFYKVYGGTSVQSICKECNKLRAKAWAKNPVNIEKNRARSKRSRTNNNYNKEYRKSRKDKWQFEWFSKLIELGKDKCSVCGYDKNTAALDFHHLDSSTKEYNIGELRNNRRFKTEHVDELDKCIVLCSNCHRELHNSSKNISMVEFCNVYHEYMRSK